MHSAYRPRDAHANDVNDDDNAIHANYDDDFDESDKKKEKQNKLL